MKISLNLLCMVAAIAFGSQAVAQTPASSMSGRNGGASADHRPSKAEVQADLAVWKRAGMERLWSVSETPDIYSREYRAAHAEYLRMKNGSEYQEELQRRQ